MDSSAIAFSTAEECGIFTFFDRSSSALPPTRPGVHEVDLDRVAVEQLEEPVALQPVPEREERVGAGHAQELALLRLAAGAGPGGLAEHEVRGGLGLGQARDGGDDVLVPVQDEQVVDPADVAGVRVAGQVGQREHRAAVLRVRLLEEVHPSGVVLVHVLQVCAGLGHRAVDVRLEVGVQGERLGEAAVLAGVHLPGGHERDEVVLDRGASRSAW
jgi:hypothetical protein